MPAPPPTTRIIRVVCISDTQNIQPLIPPGDILIHVGSLTNSGTYDELARSVSWLELIPDFKAKFIVPGKHDTSLDGPFYKEYGTYFHNRSREDTAACLNLFTSSASLTFLNHESRSLTLPFSDGTFSRIKVFGSPYSPSRGLWAFGYAPEHAAQKWADIPLDADIVITHTPPKFHCDESSTRGAAGCEDLRRALWRVRPRLHGCGLIEGGRGVESVLWCLEDRHVRYKEAETFYWNQPSTTTGVPFCVDLTKTSIRPLRNDGGKRRTAANFERYINPAGSSLKTNQEQEQEQEHLPRVLTSQNTSKPAEPFPQSSLAIRPIPALASPRPSRPASHGLGGVPSPPTSTSPSSSPSDTEALLGRSGRLETCIVNASPLPLPAGVRVLQGENLASGAIVIDLEVPVVRDRADEWYLRQLGRGGRGKRKKRG